jgi:RND family efflux transporter MFP subunit
MKITNTGRWRQRGGWALGLTALLLGGAGLGVWGGWKPWASLQGPAAQAASAAPTAKDAAVPLEFSPHEVVQPQRSAWSHRLEFSGPLVAPQTATVRARAGGTLIALEVAEGSRVQAGQVLGRIELPELGSRMAERQAQLEAAEAALAQAQRTHGNNQSLAQQQFISASALDSSRLALQSAQAQRAAAAAALDTTRSGLRDARLLAPISGIVARRHALPGEQLAPEQAVLTVVDLRQLELAGSVGTHEVAQLAPGLPVQVQVEGLPAPVAGQIARIAPAAEPGTRSIGITIGLPNPDERLRAGQYALAWAALTPAAGSPEALTVPEAALLQAHGQDQVWVIADGVLARRAVQLGRRDAAAGRVEVLQGLAPDSQVLAARFDSLREGAPARVASAAAPKAQAAAALAAASAARTGLAN